MKLSISANHIKYRPELDVNHRYEAGADIQVPVFT